MKSRLQSLLILLCLILTLVGSASAQEATTLRIGIAMILDTINPVASFYGDSIFPLWLDTLAVRGDGMELEPSLAESWSVSEDSRTWTFKIRGGVAFSDGTLLTASEVAWNINWIAGNDEVPKFASLLENVESATAPDATTLEVTMTQPVADIATSDLISIGMLSPGVWQELTTAEIMELNDPIVTTGSGPYRMTEFQPGEYLIMDANENYWRGKPPVDRIIFQEYGNEDALVQALLAGEVDLLLSVPPASIQPLTDSGMVEVVAGSSPGLLNLTINSSPDGTQPASLDDPIVRQAIAHAIDKQGIINVIFFGNAEQATTVVPAAMGDYHNSEIEDAAYDLDEANRLLDEAGYVDSDGDGVREYSDGTPLEYRLYAPDIVASFARAIEIFSQDLADIGINAPPTVMSDESLIATQIDYDFDMFFFGWKFDYDPAGVFDIFSCDQTADGGWNDSGYCNEGFDALIEAQATAGSIDERREIVWRMQEMLFEDKPYIPVVYPQNIVAYRSDRVRFAPELAIQDLYWALFDGFEFVTS